MNSPAVHEPARTVHPTWSTGRTSRPDPGRRLLADRVAPQCLVLLVGEHRRDHPATRSPDQEAYPASRSPEQLLPQRLACALTRPSKDGIHRRLDGLDVQRGTWTPNADELTARLAEAAAAV